jgi:Flp pilus assembly CpaF family ATPase
MQMSANRDILGESRDDMVTMLNATNARDPGSMCTLHANHPTFDDLLRPKTAGHRLMAA